MPTAALVALTVLASGCAGAVYPAISGGLAMTPGFTRAPVPPAPPPVSPRSPPPEIPTEGISESCRQTLHSRGFARDSQIRNGGSPEAIDQGTRMQIQACQDSFARQQAAEASSQAAIQRYQVETEERRRVAAEREASIAAAQHPLPTAAVAPTPPPDDPGASEFRLPPVERQRRAAVRAAKQAEKVKRAREDAEAEKAWAEAQARADEAFCGEPPKRSGWDGIWVGLERSFKKVAHDPDSIEFTSCGDLVKRKRPSCWVTVCSVRGKNMMGNKILADKVFGKAADGWRLLGN